jgi:hypothetical protein
MREEKIWGVPRNGTVAAAMLPFPNPLLRMVGRVEEIGTLDTRPIVVDLVCDTGATLRSYKELGLRIAAVFQKRGCELELDFKPLIYEPDHWLYFPWEHYILDNPEVPVTAKSEWLNGLRRIRT